MGTSVTQTVLADTENEAEAVRKVLTEARVPFTEERPPTVFRIKTAVSVETLKEAFDKLGLETNIK